MSWLSQQSHFDFHQRFYRSSNGWVHLGDCLIGVLLAIEHCRKDAVLSIATLALNLLDVIVELVFACLFNSVLANSVTLCLLRQCVDGCNNSSERWHYVAHGTFTATIFQRVGYICKAFAGVNLVDEAINSGGITEITHQRAISLVTRFSCQVSVASNQTSVIQNVQHVVCNAFEHLGVFLETNRSFFDDLSNFLFGHATRKFIRFKDRFVAMRTILFPFSYAAVIVKSVILCGLQQTSGNQIIFDCTDAFFKFRLTLRISGFNIIGKSTSLHICADFLHEHLQRNHVLYAVFIRCLFQLFRIAFEQSHRHARSTICRHIHATKDSVSSVGFLAARLCDCIIEQMQSIILVDKMLIELAFGVEYPFFNLLSSSFGFLSGDSGAELLRYICGFFALMALVDVLSGRKLFCYFFNRFNAVFTTDDSYTANFIRINLTRFEILAELTQLLSTNLGTLFLSFALLLQVFTQSLLMLVHNSGNSVIASASSIGFF